MTVVGTVGYRLLGLGWLDALYQTVITVSTVGFREVGEIDPGYQLFTIALVLSGVGVALYTLSVFFESLVEGQLTDRFGRRRMERHIAGMSGHIIICGWGRVGRTIERFVSGPDRDVVVVEHDDDRADTVPGAVVRGDATQDDVLRAAGIDRASVLVAALDSDADNLFVTVSARALRPDLFVVARVRVETSEAKLLQAGANRVVNPQQIGGARMAALATQPAVADFLDVVMHDGSLEFQLTEIPVAEGSTLAGRTLRDAHIRDQTGALVLAIQYDGDFHTNPAPDTVLTGGSVLIAVGTVTQLDALRTAAGA